MPHTGFFLVLTRLYQYSLLRDFRFIAIIYGCVVVVAAVQQLYLHQINNYFIFTYSFPHLIDNQNLYAFFSNEYGDNYKYGPVFALTMAPFALMPHWLGVTVWIGVNTLLLFIAIRQLTISDTQKAFIYWFILIEFLTAAQNLQANAMLTALILFCFVCFEKNNVFWAAFFVVLGGYFKLYGFIGGAFFLLYPQKFRFILSFLFWAVVLFLLPLICVSFDQLLFLYKEWYLSLVEKTMVHWDISLMQILQTIIHPGISDRVVMLMGVFVFCLAYTRWKEFQYLSFRLLFLSSVLIWMVIFSPGAESPTYIVAVTGVAIWYVCSRREKWQTWLLIFTLVVTSLSSTDVFPAYLRETYIHPYSLKALPCVVVWGAVMAELLVGSFSKRSVFVQV